MILLQKEYSILHTGDSGDEYWKLAKNGDKFAILASNNIYDAKDSMSNVRILVYNETSDSIGEFVSNSISLKPQLAHLYFLGAYRF